MKIMIVTSFSQRGYEIYGKRFIESYYDSGNRVPLTVYYETDRIPTLPGPIYRRLMNDLPQKYLKTPYANGVIGTKNNKPLVDYRFQAAKFCKKVFAMTEFPEESDWRLWIDADVEFGRELDDRFFENTCQGLCSYIGRTTWHTSECGFLAFNTAHPTILCFLDEFRALYETGGVFRLSEWHDSYVFDHLRTKYSQSGLWASGFFDLAKGIQDNHPWPRTILGQYMVHRKGPREKIEVYGDTV